MFLTLGEVEYGCRGDHAPWVWGRDRASINPKVILYTYFLDIQFLMGTQPRIKCNQVSLFF